MIIHGRTIKVGGKVLQLRKETSCTLNIKSGNKNIAGYSNREDSSVPTLRSWTIEAQFRFTWALFSMLFSLIFSRKNEAATWTVSGDGSDTIWTFTGRGYITRLGFAAQGVGLVALNITIKGTGAPSWTEESKIKPFILGTSRLGSNNVI